MKFIKLLNYFLAFSAFTSFGQQKVGAVFYLENRITAGSGTTQIHAMWEGMKNPLIISCNDPKITFTIHSTGGTILNEGSNHAFDLVPFQKDVELFAISTTNDTLYTAALICRKMISPTFELLSGTKTIGDNSTIYKNNISLLSINVLANPTLKRDLIELPKYTVDKIEMYLIRDKKTILSVNSLSNLDSIKRTARSGDQLTIVISSYSYTNGLNTSITTPVSRVFQLKVI